MIDFQPRHVLCLLDLSPVSSVVVSWMRFLAQHFPFESEIFHAAWSGMPKDPDAPPRIIDTELQETELHATIAQLVESVAGPAVPYRIVVAEGHPIVTVLQHIEAHMPDLIILGSHGYDGLARTMMGSVAENVVRMAPCPMLVVKGDELPPSQMGLGGVVCPVNLTDFARECAQVASQLAATTGATLDLVLAAEESHADTRAMQARLGEWSRAALGASSTHSDLVLRGDAGEQIVAFLREHAADVVVVGAEHRPFLEFTTLGRTTERLMRYSPCSVLVLPRKP